MTKPRTINIIAAAIMVAAWSWLYWFSHPRPPRLDRLPHEAIGQRLAAEVLARSDADAQIIVIMRDPRPFQVPASVAQFDGFQRALRQAKRRVAITRRLQVDPLRPVGVPPGEFFEILRAARADDVIVSFLGPPVLDGDQLGKLGAKRPRVLAVCVGALPAQVDLEEVFNQKLLSAAVILRDNAPSRSSARSPEAAFHQMFRLITPENLAELPATDQARRHPFGAMPNTISPAMCSTASICPASPTLPVGPSTGSLTRRARCW